MRRQTLAAALSGAATVALALTVFAVPASAQDARTTPFEGCWSPVGGSGPDLCIASAEGGLELIRYADGRETAREFLPLNASRDVEHEGCRGVERARFSDDGTRILVRTEYVCDGGLERVESGILAWPAGSGSREGPGAAQLLDVRAVTLGDESVAWVQRYRTDAAPGTRSDAMRVEVARRVAAAPLQPADVVDAAEMVDARALEAWIAESGSSFDLDAGTLVALADAGVAPDVLDVMIAVSHPEHFALAVDDGMMRAEVVDRGGVARNGWAAGGWGFSPWGWGAPGAFGWNPAFGSAFGWDPFFAWSPFGFNRFGWNSRFGAFGRAGWGGWGGGWGGGVVVVPGGNAGGVDSGGRVVNGRGYTSGRRGTSTGRSAAPSGRSRPQAAPSRGSSTGGGAVSRGSRSGSGRSTGRTAKPRRGGGGL